MFSSSKDLAPSLGAQFSSTFGRAPKVLWIASAGGHLAQAHRIEEAIGRNPESVWITFDVAQSRSLLNDRRTEFVDYVAPRDLFGAIKASNSIASRVRTESFDFCISTGAAIASVSLPRVANRGIPTFYVESIARSTGPSLTGKWMRFAPRVSTFTQYPSWADHNWHYGGSILDQIMPVAQDVAVSASRRIFVTLGTIRPYRFDRAVDAVLSALAPGDHVTWQLGSTIRDDLPGDTHSELSGQEMKRLMSESDVVVTHAGVGSILAALELGKIPVLAIREQSHGEHIDNHQHGIADVMTSRGLAYVLDLNAPSASVYDSAAGFTTVLASA